MGEVNTHLALDVHEEGVGGLYQPFQLVLTLLQLSRRVEHVIVRGENLRTHNCVATIENPSINGFLDMFLLTGIHRRGNPSVLGNGLYS